MKEMRRRIGQVERHVKRKQGLPPLIVVTNGEPGPDEVARVTKEAIEKTGLPPLVIHCSVLTEQREAHEYATKKTD